MDQLSPRGARFLYLESGNNLTRATSAVIFDPTTAFAFRRSGGPAFRRPGGPAPRYDPSGTLRSGLWSPRTPALWFPPRGGQTILAPQKSRSRACN